MRILAIASLYPLSSDDYVGTAMHLNFRPLCATGHEIHVIRPQMRLYSILSRDWRRKGARPIPASYVLDGVPVSCPRYWRLPGKRWRAVEARWRYQPIARIAREEHARKPFDLLYGCELMPDGVVAVRLAEELQLPVLLSSIGSDAHTYPFESSRAMRETRFALERADLILVEASGAVNDIRRITSETGPVHVFSRGIDLARYRNAPPRDVMRRSLKLPPDRRVIVFVGALNEGKGVRLLAGAFDRVRSKFPDVDLALMGAGPLGDWIRDEAGKQGWGDRLHLLGRRSFNDVPHILMACDVFCLPSYGEGLPKSVVEAMAAGLPIIATTVGGIPDVMCHGECGILIPPGRVDDLTQALDRLLANPAQAAKMGTIGHAVAYEHFDADRNAVGLIRFGEEAVVSGRERLRRSKGA